MAAWDSVRRKLVVPALCATAREIAEVGGARVARTVVCIATFLALLCRVAPVAAQIHSAQVTDDPVQLTAKTVVFDVGRDLYEARGSVEV